jgi:hypothetical protein
MNTAPSLKLLEVGPTVDSAGSTRDRLGVGKTGIVAP